MDVLSRLGRLFHFKCWAPASSIDDERGRDRNCHRNSYVIHDSGRSVHLEANLREPDPPPRGAVVVCHPHPVYGGTMDNRIVYRAAKAAAAAGFAALRFNFRGTGQSTGLFDQGIGEKEDAAAAIRWLEGRYPGLPMALIGYSFGAWVGLQVAHSDPGVGCDGRPGAAFESL